MFNKKQKVLVSTDIGSDIDDALSLLIMFNSGINVQGIYTTNAKDLRFRSYIAKHMVNLRRKKFLGIIPDLWSKKITVAQGEANPINNTIEPYWYHEDCFVDRSFEDDESSRVEIDTQFKPLEEVGIVRNGLEDLANKLEKGKYVIFSLAPLTNIAKIIQDYPTSVKNIKHLYIMGSSLYGGLEHNVRYDPIAVSIVHNSDIPMTIIPTETCSKYKMDVSMLDQLKKSKVGNYVRNMARGFIASKTALKSHYLSNDIKGSSKTNILDKLLVNLNDSYFGSFEPEEYFNQYYRLIDYLRDPKNKNYLKDPIRNRYIDGNVIAGILEGNVPRDISVADVYVPYCFLHQEKLKTQIIGSKDTRIFVVDLDYNHFQEFVKQHLH